ncbi:MAG: MFS transporter, partial [Streptosporangiales bacterium]|nr:MFS transporter [Streptosporangiales bacterium]
MIALCVTEITSWGILYYAFPVVVAEVTRDTGWATATAMAAFSTGAITSALAGVVVGRLIDAHGPRPVMTGGAVLGVVALLAIAAAPNLPLFFAAWVLAGAAQAALLYPPAFIAITRWYGPDRVRALTTVTLAGGFASTVFAPITAVLLEQFGWRATYLVLAGILAVIVVPLHAIFLTPPWPGRHVADPAADGAPVDGAEHARRVLRGRGFAILAGGMAAGAFGMYAATVNLVPLFTSRGMSTQLAALGLGLCGAGQVLGRIFYGVLTRRTSPRGRTFLVVAAGGVTVVTLGLYVGPAVLMIAVAVVAGMVRGIYTLLQATAVADRWGTVAFGRINGVFTAPIQAVTALAPAGGALFAELAGGYPSGYTLLALLTFAGATATLLVRDHPAPAR